MRLFLSFNFVISLVLAFDVIRDSFELIDFNTDPCSNFYRHACPLSDNPELHITTAYKKKLSAIRAKSVDALWKNLEIERVFENTRYKELPTPFTFIADLFRSRCENEQVTIAEKEAMLLRIQKSIILNNEECEEESCLTSLAHDKNCTRAAEILEKRFYRVHTNLNDYGQFRRIWSRAFLLVHINLDGVTAVLDADLREGVSILKDVVDKLVNKLSAWIEVTPWVNNNEATEAILNEAQQVHLYDNYGKVLRDNLNFVLGLEQSYLKCLRDTHNDANFEIFCMLVATSEKDEKLKNVKFFSYFNAFNDHPLLSFSSMFYDMAINVEEFAGFLGSVGYIAGHEVSHTMIENSAEPQLIPYFSNESMQCIQGQYQKTCDSFKETSCGAEDNQIDENGADMLGLRLVYSLFEDHYGENIHDVYINISDTTITMQKLFFYSTAFISCIGSPGEQHNDPHSPWNIRINAVMQHPAFRQAFQCDPESEMVKSFGDECVIFGDNAPETRK